MSFTPTVGAQYTRTQVFTVLAVDAVNRTADLQEDDGTLVTRKWAFLSALQEVLPPATQFQPGQMVVRLSDGALFTLTNGGYFDHQTGALIESSAVFTSNSFRLAVVS
jgi:hypothetical protein